MENRTIRISFLPLTLFDLERVRTQFDSLYLLQEARRERMHDLLEQINWLEKKTFPMEGADLFSSEQKLNWLEHLELEDVLKLDTQGNRGVNSDGSGTEYEVDSKSMKAETKEIQESQENKGNKRIEESNKSDGDVWIDSLFSKPNLIRSQPVKWNHQFAVDLIVHEKGINPKYVYCAKIQNNRWNELTESIQKEKGFLKELVQREYLEGRLQTRVLFRLGLVIQSLESNSICGPVSQDMTLFREDVSKDGLYDPSKYQEAVIQLLRNKNAKGFSELALARFEDQWNALHGRKPIRKIFSEDPFRAPMDMPLAINETHRILLLQSAHEKYRKLKEKMSQEYSYSLIQKNCVTEIFRTFRTLGPEEERKLFGGTVDENVYFIPFIAYSQVRSEFHLNEERIEDSFRYREIKRIYQDRMPWGEYFVLTSSAYRWHKDDGFFVAFADKTPFIRPVFGLANFSAGFVEFAAGIPSAPFNKGRMLTSGLAGMLYSIPELFFFNIRKGTYTDEESTKRALQEFYGSD